MWENPQSRLDNIVETQFKKLEFVYNFAKKNKAVVCQAGDLVNKPRSWYLMPLLMKFFGRWNASGVPTYMVRGQHDHYYYSEASSPATCVGVLLEAGLLNLVQGAKPIKLELDDVTVNLYGSSFGEKVPEPKKYSPNNLLLIHREISDTALFAGHKYFSHKGFLKRHKHFKLIVCADIHRKFKARIKGKSGHERYLVNTGPMLRASATSYNFDHKPGFYVWDAKNQTLHWKLIPCEDADTVLTRAHIEATERDQRKLAELSIKLKSKGIKDQDGYTFKGGLDSYMEEHSVGKDAANIIAAALEEVDMNDL